MSQYDHQLFFSTDVPAAWARISPLWSYSGCLISFENLRINLLTANGIFCSCQMILSCNWPNMTQLCCRISNCSGGRIRSVCSMGKVPCCPITYIQVCITGGSLSNTNTVLLLFTSRLSQRKIKQLPP